MTTVTSDRYVSRYSILVQHGRQSDGQHHQDQPSWVIAVLCSVGATTFVPVVRSRSCLILGGTTSPIILQSTELKLQSKLNKSVSSFVLALRVAMLKKIAVTVSAVAFVMLAIALAPGVPTVLATAPTNTSDDAKSSHPLADQSCAAFEVWFLDATCRQPHAKRAARTKQRLAQKLGR